MFPLVRSACTETLLRRQHSFVVIPNLHLRAGLRTRVSLHVVVSLGSRRSEEVVNTHIGSVGDARHVLVGRAGMYRRGRARNVAEVDV